MPSREIDKSENRFWTHWNADSKQFFLQLAFKLEKGTGTNQDMFQIQQIANTVGIGMPQAQALNAYVQIRQPTQMPMMLNFLQQ